MDNNIFLKIIKIIERESKFTTNRDETVPVTTQQALTLIFRLKIVLSETFID